ncbi:MAG: TIGR04282 family arsenosugar biosynthesis glycosyltransferase [Rhodovibrionaceae bacterium]
MNRWLVVMARAPQLGQGKRRLAAEIGDLAAWRFARLNVDALLRRLAPDPRWRTLVAVTPDRAATRGVPGWEIPLLPQGGGDLGMRMGRIFQALPPGPAVIVGSDVPGIGRAQVARAFAALGKHDWALGPSPDGGYWLIGAKRSPVLRLPFAGVRWSTQHARADTLANLEAQGARVALLEELADVDTAADL